MANLKAKSRKEMKISQNLLSNLKKQIIKLKENKKLN